MDDGAASVSRHVGRKALRQGIESPVDVVGGLELLENRLIFENLADAREDVQVLVSLSRDAKEQIGLLAIKIDSIGILLQNNARALDGILRLACSVRDGDAHAQVDAGDLVVPPSHRHTARRRSPSGRASRPTP